MYKSRNVRTDPRCQGRLLSQTLDGTDARLYSYDANGNIRSQTASAENKAYAYDSLDRLITDATDGAAVDITYDLNGNRLGRSAEDGSLQEHNDYLLGSNRLALSDLVASTLPTLTPPAERVFNYNNRGRLYQLFDNGVLMATYVYNAEGLRSRKITDQGTTIYHYDQFGLLISETAADGALIKDYLWQDFEPVAQIEANPTSERIVYLHTDHLNTPRLASNGTPSIQWRWQGEAFGLTPAEQDVDADGTNTVINLRFAGQYYDSETGLHYNWNRYYGPGTGRYITADPIGQLAGPNLYAYVGNNPINAIDPFGLYWFRQSWQEPGVVGREGTIVPPGGSVSEFIERSVPAGYTFGEMHDTFVEGATNAGFPDWLVNIPSMIPMYGGAVGKEILRDLGILEQPVPPIPESGPCK